MPKRFTLFALWAVFAAAAVGVGFGASGLLGQPFTAAPSAADVGSSGVVADSSSPTDTASPSLTAASSATADAAVQRGIPTRGGFVSATCRGRWVELSVSPAVGWRLKDRTSGQARTARVRFEPNGDAHGERVTVDVRCASGSPVFDREDRRADADGSRTTPSSRSTAPGRGSSPSPTGSDDNGGGDDHGGGGGGGGSGGGDD
ncbi:MAG: hypothetical protein QOI54_1803 [Actinomycetota bacterium]|jgi:hypothetical protein|nr:hypothetical protein [Actinomycetota bacterium]